MIVSQFRLRNDPTSRISYVLLITNLANDGYFFRIFVNAGNASLESKTIVDVTGESYSGLLTLAKSGEKFGTIRYKTSETFPVEPQETVLLRISPAVDPMHSVGHVELTIPAAYKEWNSSSEAQGDKPVKLILHAYSEDRNPQTWQRNYAPFGLAGCCAEVELMPDQPSRGRVSVGKIKLAELSKHVKEQAKAHEEALTDPLVALAGTLTTLHAAARDTTELRSLNALITEANLPFKLVASKTNRKYR